LSGIIRSSSTSVRSKHPYKPATMVSNTDDDAIEGESWASV
jgi:hypothetical protein